MVISSAGVSGADGDVMMHDYYHWLMKLIHTYIHTPHTTHTHTYTPFTYIYT